MTTAVKTTILIALAISTSGAETSDRNKVICGKQKTTNMKTANQSRESISSNYEEWKKELYLSPLSKAILFEF
jgi:hypothetical protein